MLCDIISMFNTPQGYSVACWIFKFIQIPGQNWCDLFQMMFMCHQISPESDAVSYKHECQKWCCYHNMTGSFGLIPGQWLEKLQTPHPPYHHFSFSILPFFSFKASLFLSSSVARRITWPLTSPAALHSIPAWPVPRLPWLPVVIANKRISDKLCGD